MLSYIEVQYFPGKVRYIKLMAWLIPDLKYLDFLLKMMNFEKSSENFSVWKYVGEIGCHIFFFFFLFLKRPERDMILKMSLSLLVRYLKYQLQYYFSMTMFCFSFLSQSTFLILIILDRGKKWSRYSQRGKEETRRYLKDMEGDFENC